MKFPAIGSNVNIDRVAKSWARTETAILKRAVRLPPLLASRQRRIGKLFPWMPRGRGFRKFPSSWSALNGSAEVLVDNAGNADVRATFARDQRRSVAR